jgi:uncharacterized protein YjbI with pentapeptide repeats
VTPNFRRFLPLLLIGFVLVLILSSVLRKHTSSTTCNPGASATCVGADLSNADLAKGTLTKANFTQADLSNADLYSANLTGANLQGADLSGADLARATLTHARLQGANLTGADLDGAVHADLTGAIVCHTLLPSGKFPAHGC